MNSDKPKYHRPTSEVEEQLASVKSLMVSEPAAEYGKGAWFQARADATHLKDLEQELDESITAELRNADLTLALDGAPVRGHRVKGDFLSTMIAKAQGLVNALAAAMERPDVRNTTPDAKEENCLYVGPSFASSYGLRFSLLKADELGRIPISNQEEVLKGLTTLLDASSAVEDVERLLSRHPRVRSNYRDLVETIASNGARITARTHTQRSGVRMSPEQAHERAVRLRTAAGNAVELPPMKGILVGGDTATRSFHLVVGDNEYKGELSDEACLQVPRFRWNAHVTAYVRATTKQAADGTAAKPEYMLLKVTATRAKRKKG